MKRNLQTGLGLAGLSIRRAMAVLFPAFLLFFNISLSAQSTTDKDAAFRKTLTDRSAKIVAGLGLSGKKKNEKITQLIASQYYQLNKVHDQSLEQTEKTKALESLHQRFVTRLNRKLNKEQVEKVKNGMTYNVLNVTYTAYQDMILTLTSEQKEKIYQWLLEAREKAMMEGSSEAKHKMFGKYKGKINNYLSEQGFNMKAEEKAWQQRLKEKRAKDAAGKQEPA